MNFKPMLAAKANPAKLKFPLVIQPKLDGIRCSIVDGRALSRTLKEIPNREIFTALSRPNLNGLDGEIIVGEPTADDCYRTTASFVMAASKTGAPWTFRVFDKWDEPSGFLDRYHILSRLPEVSLSAKIILVPTLSVPHKSALEDEEASAIAKGYEGLILRSPDAPYKFGRGSVTAGDLLKLKRFEDFEAEIIGAVEEFHNANAATTNALGRTERSSHKEGKVGKGTLGAFIVRAINGPAEGVEFKVGTGFDARQRAEFWALASVCDYGYNGMNGQIIKVKSFPVGVKDKPRHPVFLGFRDLEIDG